jgi:hypothetical protein
MGDGDTLAMAEERVLRRAQRRAIEEAGIYIESIFIDSEKSSDGRDIQSTALEIRTIAAAVTKTVILASRRAFEHDRPTFYVKYGRNWTSTMQQAVRRWKSDEQVQETHERQ